MSEINNSKQKLKPEETQSGNMLPSSVSTMSKLFQSQVKPSAWKDPHQLPIPTLPVHPKKKKNSQLQTPELSLVSSTKKSNLFSRIKRK